MQNTFAGKPASGNVVFGQEIRNPQHYFDTFLEPFADVGINLPLALRDQKTIDVYCTLLFPNH